MPTGKVKWFNASKGYGFIEMDEGRDVFVHYTAIQVPGFRTLDEGQVVNFEVVDSPQGSPGRACDPCWLRHITRDNAGKRPTVAPWGLCVASAAGRGGPTGERVGKGRRHGAPGDRRGGRIAYARHDWGARPGCHDGRGEGVER